MPEMNVTKIALPGAAAYCAGGEAAVWNTDSPAGRGATEEFAALFGVPPKDTVRIKQEHTAVVRAVGRESAGEGILRPAVVCDGMVTNEPGLVLCTFEADCVPVFLSDPVRRAVGMIHSGRRGTALEISVEALSLMRERYGTEPSDVYAALGPCICGDCYEVGAEVLPDFAPRFTDAEIASFARTHGEKYLLDLPAAIRLTLIRAGVRPDRIAPSPECTCHGGSYPSYRRNGTDKRMITGIMIR